MRSRRITIEGDRYLIFYTFDDEPRLGPAADGDAGARSSDEQGDARTSHALRSDAAPSLSPNSLSPRADGEADQTNARQDQPSPDGEPVAGAKRREGEGRGV